MLRCFNATNKMRRMRKIRESQRPKNKARNDSTRLRLRRGGMGDAMRGLRQVAGREPRVSEGMQMGERSSENTTN